MHSGKRGPPQYSEEDYDSKPRKKVCYNAEDTTHDQALPYPDPADLRNYITDATTIKRLQEIGIKGLFPIQYSTFRQIYRGKDIRGKDKTGSGKTLAFSLPVIQRFR